jgi:hypothetical protein
MSEQKTITGEPGARPSAAPPPVPAPPAGLGSSSNYLMARPSGGALPDVTATIDVTEDMVLRDASGSYKGFSFQLNCYPPRGSQTVWQQYGFVVLGQPGINSPVAVPPATIVDGFIDNWTSLTNQDDNNYFSLGSISNKITVVPKGTRLAVTVRGDGLFRGTWAAAASGGWNPSPGGGLLLYDRGAGVGAFYLVSENGLLVKLGEHDDWRRSWDLVATGSWGANGTGLLLYDRVAHTGSFFSVSDSGTLNPLATYTDWRASWDLAVTGNWTLAGTAALLLYDRAAGTGEFYSVSGSGGIRLMASHTNWNTTWDLAVSGNWGLRGQSGLLLYDRAAGTGAFFSVSGSGSIVTLQNDTTWRTSWDIIIAGDWAPAGHTGLFFYDRAASFGAFYSVDAAGRMTLLSQTTFPQDSWDLAVAGNWGAPGSGGLMLYDSAAGTGEFYSVSTTGVMTLTGKYNNSIYSATWSIGVNGKTVLTDTKSLRADRVPASEIDPILACQMNIVGPVNGEGARLSQGAGTITYSSSVPLIPTSAMPANSVGFSTAETANTTYGQLLSQASTTIVQNFAVKPSAPPPVTTPREPGRVVRPVPPGFPRPSTTP